MSKWTSFLGRFGQICDRVLTLLDDKRGNGNNFITEDEMLLWGNDCQEDIAKEGYWTEPDETIDLVAGQSVYPLSALSRICLWVNKVTATDINRGLDTITDWETYEKYLKYARSTSYTQAVMVADGYLRVIPTPIANKAAALRINYNYIPPVLGGGSELVLSNTVAVTDRGSGLVNIPTVGTDLAPKDRIAITGSTHYDGEYDCQPGTTSSVAVIRATYAAETMASTVKLGRYYTPLIPQPNDCVFVESLCHEACRKDNGRRQMQIPLFEQSKKKEMEELLRSRTHGMITIGPVR